MGVKTLVSVEEYLRTSYEGVDREYRDGEILERSVPNYDHGTVQMRFGFLFGRLGEQHGLRACSETRMRLGQDRVLIPDIAVLHPEKPATDPPTQPPLIVIEILSPTDRHSEVHQKLEEFRQWGVANVWLVDPQLRKMYVYNGGLREVTTFELAEPAIRIPAAEVFV